MVKIMEDIIKRVSEAIEKSNVSKKEIAEKLGYKSQSGLTNALKDRSLKATQLQTISEMLGMKPSDFLSEHNLKLDITEASLYDLIKFICRNEIDGYLQSHKK